MFCSGVKLSKKWTWKLITAFDISTVIILSFQGWQGSTLCAHHASYKFSSSKSTSHQLEQTREKIENTTQCPSGRHLLKHSPKPHWKKVIRIFKTKKRKFTLFCTLSFPCIKETKVKTHSSPLQVFWFRNVDMRGKNVLFFSSKVPIYNKVEIKRKDVQFWSIHWTLGAFKIDYWYKYAKYFHKITLLYTSQVN